jgi:hypothetical protein
MRSRRSIVGAVGASLTLAVTLAVPISATAATTSGLTVSGVPLASSVLTSGRFTVAVAAPNVSGVKFKLDGTYLGEDKTAPFTWPVVTGIGSHKLNARWDGGDTTSTFTVSGGSSTPPPVATPTASPVAPAQGTTPTATTTVPVSTSAQLKTALAAARPGQVIALASGTYTGKFESAASGTAAAPITLTGPRTAVLTTGSVDSGYALHLTGSQWRVTGIAVRTAAKGIVLDGSRFTRISRVEVGNIGAEAVHFRKGSSDGVIENSLIHHTGITSPQYGEGVYIGSAVSNWSSIMGSSTTPDRSDRVIVRGNDIRNTPAEGVDVKEGSTGGSITGNSFTASGTSGRNSADSWIDVKGNDYVVSGNQGTGTLLDAMQVHTVVAGWGARNRFSGNTVIGAVPGYEVWVQGTSIGNRVACDTSAAAKGLSNIPCS